MSRSVWCASQKLASIEDSPSPVAKECQVLSDQ